MDEFALIDAVFRPLALDPAAQGLRDDGACLPPLAAGQEWRVSTDTLVEGVHFRGAVDAADLAWRALAVSVSDLIAQLATPQFYLLNLSQGQEFDTASFGRGLAQAQAAFGLSLIGGDTTLTPGSLTLSLTVLGRGQNGDNPLRAQARVGQGVYLLLADPRGLGAARAGFLGVDGFSQAFLRPAICLDHLASLQGQGIAAMVDVSDGLLQDLGHICAASGVGAVVHLATLPLALPDQAPLPQLTWGEDFALVFTADAPPPVPGLIQIGLVRAEPGVQLLDDQGQEIPVQAPGYLHGRGL